MVSPNLRDRPKIIQLLQKLAEVAMRIPDKANAAILPACLSLSASRAKVFTNMKKAVERAMPIHIKALNSACVCHQAIKPEGREAGACSCKRLHTTFSSRSYLSTCSPVFIFLRSPIHNCHWAEYEQGRHDVHARQVPPAHLAVQPPVECCVQRHDARIEEHRR